MDIRKYECQKCKFGSRCVFVEDHEFGWGCEYFEKTGKLRNCKPGTCKENGKFEVR